MPLLRRAGRPGLLGMAARTAVVAGTATAVSGNVARRQQNRAEAAAAQQEAEIQRRIAEETAFQPAYAAAPVAPVAPPAPPAAPPLDLVSQLQQLGELKQQGLLSEAEFEQAKKQLMGL